MAVDINTVRAQINAASEYDKHLFIDDSQIRGAGWGVYSDIFIPKDTLITEYFGRGYPENATFSPDDQVYLFKTYNDTIINPDPRSIARYINDTVDLPRSKKYGKVYRYPDLLHNVTWYIVTDPKIRDPLKKERVFIITTENIHPGDELYIDYGDPYWSAFVTPDNVESYLTGDDIYQRLIDSQRKIARRYGLRT